MRLIIRITRTTISFTAPNTVIEGQTDFEQYSMKTGISVAANMRQALADCRLLQVHTSPTQNGQTMPSQYHPVFSQVRVYVDTSSSRLASRLRCATPDSGMPQCLRKSFAR